MKLDENAISPMWKKHQNLLSNNNDAHSITKYGFLVQPYAQIVAMRAHCASAPPPPPSFLPPTVHPGYDMHLCW